MKKVITAAVAPMRAEASDKSEMISQALMGEPIEVLEQRDKWSLIRLLTDGYEGWIDNKQVAPSHTADETVMLTSAITRCELDAGEAQWLPAGARIPEQWKPGSVQPEWKGTLEDIAVCARQFLHAPYLWGGRTILGIDCSGFTQLVLALNGIAIPRDAYQQAELGETVSFLEETQTGDLAFFDNAEGRITHVGIVLRDTSNQGLIIHASGKVRIDIIDHQGIYNRDTGHYTHQLRIVKRMRG